MKELKCQLTGMVAWVIVEPSRDVKSLPLAPLGDFVRGRTSAFEPREAGR